MTDQGDNTNDPAPMYDDMDDVELITSYLNGHLDAERAEAVRKRLEEDPAFHEFAAPLLIVWSIPPLHERKPRPEGELERSWAEFVHRTGFGEATRELERQQAEQQERQRAHEQAEQGRRDRRRRWRYGLTLAFVTLATVGLSMVGVQSCWDRNWSIEATNPDHVPDDQFIPVPRDTGWIVIGDSIEVRLDPGASLGVAPRLIQGRLLVKLDGMARFRVPSTTNAPPELVQQSLTVRTRAGDVVAGGSEFTVIARADTTYLHVHATAHPLVHGTPKTEVMIEAVRYLGGLPGSRQTSGYTLPVYVNDSTRVVRDQLPAVFRKNP